MDARAVTIQGLQYSLFPSHMREAQTNLHFIIVLINCRVDKITVIMVIRQFVSWFLIVYDAIYESLSREWNVFFLLECFNQKWNNKDRFSPLNFCLWTKISCLNLALSRSKRRWNIELNDWNETQKRRAKNHLKKIQKVNSIEKSFLHIFCYTK